MKNWQKTEKKISRILGGKRTPGSGNKRVKGDVITKNYLIEVKETSLSKFRVNLLWFAKIKEEASQFNKNPALILEFSNGKMLCFVLSDRDSYYFDWKLYKYILVSYDDLVEGITILTPYGIWEVVNIESLKE